LLVAFAHSTTRQKRFADLRFSRLARRALPTQALPPPRLPWDLHLCPCDPARPSPSEKSHRLTHSSSLPQLHRAAGNDLNRSPPISTQPTLFLFHFLSQLLAVRVPRQTEVVFGFDSGVSGIPYRCFWAGGTPSNDPLSGARCDPLCLEPPSPVGHSRRFCFFPCRLCSSDSLRLCDTAATRSRSDLIPDSQPPSRLDRPAAIAIPPPCSSTERSGLARPV
jgi:hypothetical protein